jgi:DNA polymerase-4
VTRDVTLAAATDQAAVIRLSVGECLKRVVFEKKLRLIGIRVGSLEPADGYAEEQALQQTELSLFD